jgi:toxin CcdB
MAQFDVYRLNDGTLVVDCQAGLLSSLKSRFVVPLLLPQLVDATARLNPHFVIDGIPLHFVPQGAATIPAQELHSRVASLADERFTILNAIDVLLSGT